MHHFPYLPILIAMIVVIAIAQALKGAGSGITTRARPVLTKSEQWMYWRLREAFPDSVVLAQVAFSALITSSKRDRNRYSQKVADFVLMDRGLRVIAVIELDDWSHDGREHLDTARSRLLENAGLRVLRFRGKPELAELREAVHPPQRREPALDGHPPTSERREPTL